MGQGRNTIYLAQQGWDSVGFDPAERAVEAAHAQARTLGVRINAVVARDTEFQWGNAQWDLILDWRRLTSAAARHASFDWPRSSHDGLIQP